ncbi:MarR family transcriptional regulator [Paenibacillus hemerocallicola]|uniref:MarR family transcriptional regulator n=1 Tax=Paenibacillus hemerocallicola TaxID=1172614 RepID=A0A5C4SY56_9BACL|nr:MarR family transcriptional regulator [Paenibacillus hemerocallicola]TNJ60665.1 MarR family transcriptional regulator [Paenibacillus hemerocallicola]
MAKSPDNPGILDRSAGFMMGVTSRKLSQVFTQRLRLYDITPEQWMVLYCIQERDGMIQKEIAQRACKDKPTTTRILDVLESKQWITKQTGKSDRRSFLVYATDKGRELISQTEGIEIKTVKDATSGLSEAEYDQLLSLLRRIGDNIDHLTEKE